MEILEKFILGKNLNQEKCEDIIFFNSNFVSIIDGATSKSDYSFNGLSTGKIAALLVNEALGTLNESSTKEDAAKHISSHIYNFYLKHDYLKKINENNKNKCTASAIIYSVFHSEIWMFGDCQALIDDKLFSNNSKKIDHVSNDARAIFLGSILSNGYPIDKLLDNDISRNTIKDILETQQTYQNVPLSVSEYGYVCFDGFEIPCEDVQTYSIGKNVKKITLASDGYPKIFESLKASEEYLSYIRDKDPLCYKIFKSTKGFGRDLNSFDDRSYISFLI